MPQPNSSNTIIIGGSAGGLACAASLKQLNLPYILLEKRNKVGCEWVQRYDRLHLHTPKKHSHLPYLKMPSYYEQYVSKNDLIEYLEAYMHHFSIQPFFNEEVLKVERKNNLWEVSTNKEKLFGKSVIIATGYSRKPIQPAWKGIENFQGEIIHSSEYKNGANYKNKDVLVVGFGNSACEIALCLYELNAFPSLSVRSGVNVIPRDLAGIPILNIVIAQNWLTKISPRLTDAINKPLLRFIYGNLNRYGLRQLHVGPTMQVTKYKRIPLLDIGIMRLIKRNTVKVFPGIDHFTADTVVFTDGREKKIDAVISATGFQSGLAQLLPEYSKVSDENGIPLVSGKESALPGLYFCGFHITPTGMLREIGIEAKKIAKSLSRLH